MSPRIVFLDRSTIGPTVELGRPSFAHEWVEHEKTAAGQVAERLKGATIAVTNKAPIREADFDNLPDLKMIAIAATGYDVVDVAAAQKRGIIVSNVRGYAVNTVPEHTFALIFALRRSIIGYRQDVIDGEWQKAAQFCFFNHPIKELAGATLGIIGEGAIGQSVAKIGQALGMKTMFAAHKGVQGLGPLYTPFDQVLEESDIISLHSPLTPATRNMLAMPEFRKMKKHPLLINTARGGLVVEEDVVTALDEGLLSGIGFDVISVEPPPPGHCFEKIMKRPNVIVTPHVSWAGEDAMTTLWKQVVTHIENYNAGKPSNVIGS